MINDPCILEFLFCFHLSSEWQRNMSLFSVRHLFLFTLLEHDFWNIPKLDLTQSIFLCLLSRVQQCWNCVLFTCSILFYCKSFFFSFSRKDKTIICIMNYYYFPNSYCNESIIIIICASVCLFVCLSECVNEYYKS